MARGARKIADQILQEMAERALEHWEEYKRGEGPPLDELEVKFLQNIQAQGTADAEAENRARFLENCSQDELDELWKQVRDLGMN